MVTKRLELHLLLPSRGIECLRCIERLKEGLLRLKGVTSVKVDEEGSTLLMEVDPALLPIDKVEERAREVGLEVAERFSHRTMRIGGLDCTDCAEKIERVVSRLDGVVWVSVNVTSGRMDVEYDNSRIDLQKILDTVKGLGYEVEEGLRSAAFHIYGMDCEKEASLLERAMTSLEGIEQYRIDIAGAKLFVRYKPTLTVDEILRAIEGIGLKATLKERKAPPIGGLGSTILSGLFLFAGIAASLAGLGRAYSVPFLLSSILIGGYPVARKGILAARHLTFDMNLLMSVAVTGAVLIGEWAEGATITFLFTLSQYLESLSMERARRAIESLLQISPTKATILREGKEVEVPVEDVKVGEIMVVRPGERIALDGRIVKGSSTIDQSPVTGESVPVWKGPGEEVFAGTINREGSLSIEVTHLAKDSTLARIIHMVEEAQTRKAPVQSTVDRFAAYYTPAVIVFALSLAIIPPFLLGQDFVTWFYRALVLLVIACPCALVLSTPVSIVSALTSATRKGVLIKGGIFLEGMGRLKNAVFDKTGTLTEGRLKVTRVIALAGDEGEVLRIGASLEAGSEHPIASAILEEAEKRGVRLDQVEGFRALPGKGARGRIRGRLYFIGNHRLFEDMGICSPEVEERLESFEALGETVVLVGNDEGVIGFVTLSDSVREDAITTVRELKVKGIRRIVLLTGDNRLTAKTVADTLGIEDYRAELLPQDKAGIVRTLAGQGPTAMVGDGVNDAPALAEATVGIAMGAAGTDIAIETADVALMSDDLTKIPYLVDLSRRTLSVVKANIAFSILIKALFLILATAGMATLWMAVVADTGASLLVIFNGLRLLKG